MAMNVAWHDRHKMPQHATLAQKVKWHVAHARACGCRDLPLYVSNVVARQQSAARARRG